MADVGPERIGVYQYVEQRVRRAEERLRAEIVAQIRARPSPEENDELWRYLRRGLGLTEAYRNMLADRIAKGGP